MHQRAAGKGGAGTAASVSPHWPPFPCALAPAPTVPNFSQGAVGFGGKGTASRNRSNVLGPIPPNSVDSDVDVSSGSGGCSTTSDAVTKVPHENGSDEHTLVDEISLESSEIYQGGG